MKSINTASCTGKHSGCLEMNCVNEAAPQAGKMGALTSQRVLWAVKLLALPFLRADRVNQAAVNTARPTRATEVPG